jgi:hypothetical protein
MSNAWKVVQMLDAWSFDSRIQEIGADRVIKEAATEIEKLRAALRKLYDHEGERVLNSIGIECYTEELEDALCEARAALGEKE